MSYFQLKNSNIKNNEAIETSHTYQINHLICIYIELMYDKENNIKNNIEYIIGRGNIGT
ncbi:MAG: hypothetical protein Q8S84_08165 [bacterium]|nr:hypothetical protein [bacterium]MDP3381410.1 hypothetical protein [bacterium]